MNLQEKIYEVRKHGVLKVESKEAALELCEAAEKEGYTFGWTYHHFGGYEVVDADI